MQVSCFEKDTVFYVSGRRHVVIRMIRSVTDPDDYQKTLVAFEDMHGMFGQSTIEELLSQFTNGDLTIGDGNNYVSASSKNGVVLSHRNYENVSDEEKLDALRKQAYINAVLESGGWVESDAYLAPIIQKHAQNTEDRNQPSPSTVRRWHRLLRKNAFDWQCLLPRHDRKGNRTARFTESEQDFYERIVYREYMTKQRRTATRVYEALVKEIRDHNIKNPDSCLSVPSKSTLDRLIKNIPQYDRKYARHGRYLANTEFRQGKVAPQPTRILEIAEIDHTPIDLEVRCSRTGLVLGTPWLTLVIDSYSRMILGYHMAFDPPCVQSVVKAIEHSINPKVYLTEKYPMVSGDWPAFGKMATLVCDNGAEFHAHELEKIALNIGFIIQFCPSRTPYFKGKIERAIGTMNAGLFHDIPGTTFSNYQDRGDYESESKAALTFETLNAVVHKWIVDIYHQSLHRGINETPQKRWNRSALEFPPMLPHSAALIGQKILRITKRKLRVPGIELHNILYNNDELWELRKRIGNKAELEVHYDHEDLSHIYVRSPSSAELIRIESTVPDYTNGLMLVQHKAILRKLKEEGKSSESKVDLAQARADIEVMIEDDIRSRSKAKRRETIRKKGINSARLQIVKPQPEARVPPAPFQAMIKSSNDDDLIEFDVV